jgi:hypothetical protein
MPASAGKPNDGLTTAINGVLDELDTVLKVQNDANGLGLVCAWLKSADNDAFKKTCPGGGALIIRGDDLHDKYPRMFDRVVGNATLPSFYYKTSLNWTPSLLSVDYRDVVNKVPDLATAKHSTRLLEGTAFDYMIYYRKFVARIEVNYSETVDVQLSSVCNTTTQGTFSSQACKNAMIGAPNPYRALG